MAFNAQNTAYGNSTLPGAQGTGLTEDSYETGRAHGLQQPAGLGVATPQAGYGTGSGVAEVCDMPNVYNPTAPDAVKAVHHVTDDRRERMYDAVTVEETVVHHDVERIKPVLHQEVHQTRLHEVTHHKVAPVRDLGVVEVVHHRDTDECGNRLTTDLNTIHGTGTTHATGGMLENIKDKITGHHTSNATGYNSTTTTTHGTSGTGSGGMLENIKDKITGHPTSTATGHNTTDAHRTENVVVPATLVAVTDTVTGTNYGTNPGTHSGMTSTGHTGHVATDDKVGGIKGLINKVVPGPGPFKA